MRPALTGDEFRMVTGWSHEWIGRDVRAVTGYWLGLCTWSRVEGGVKFGDAQQENALEVFDGGRVGCSNSLKTFKCAAKVLDFVDWRHGDTCFWLGIHPSEQILPPGLPKVSDLRHWSPKSRVFPFGREDAKRLVHGKSEANADAPGGLPHPGDKLSHDQELDFVGETENRQNAWGAPSRIVRKP
jgi:hypothetical protein